MRKLLFVSICIIGFSSVFAGGIVTNTNQSASWARNPSTAAITGIEATYYNPAGLMKLNNGLHFSLNNQSIFQNREIENSFSYLNESKFKGTVKAPLFPSLYAVYKLDRFAFSFGFNPVGGGGSAEFNKGLPSFELSTASLVPSLATQGVTGYSNDAYFKGTSIYFGYQFGMSFKINDMISVYGGLRYISAKNTYEGYLRNITLTMGTTPVPASTVMAGVAANLNGMIGIPNSVQPIISGGGGTLTLAQAQTAGYLSAAQVTSISQGLVAIGVPQANISAMNISQISGAFTSATPTLTQKYYAASIGSKLLRNQQADVEQTGSGICPIIGANFTLSDKLNIGLKYEFATKMDVKNKTSLDFVTDSLPGQPATTMFPDGAKTPADMPAMFSLGISYKLMDKLSLSGSLYYYFDKNVSYGKKSIYGTGEFVSNDSLMNNNFYELAFGAEYQLTEKLLISAGVLMGNTGVKPEYNTDLSYSNSSTTFGLGCKYAFSSKLSLNLGYSYSSYKKLEKTIAEYTATESYTKNTSVIAVGLDISL